MLHVSRRIKPLEAAAHPFFDELRQETLVLPNDVAVPPLFNFSLQGALRSLVGCIVSSRHELKPVACVNRTIAS